MYRVLIVDDEPEIRNGLRLKVDWEGLGFFIVGEACNGSEALERLSAEAVDVLITDMSMPVMDGAKLLEACREQYPHLRLVVLTGYEDFQYARAALRNKAREYLLKPVARDELVTVLEKLKGELDEERVYYDEQETVRWRLSQYYKEMKEHFLLHLAKGEGGSSRETGERARLFDLEEWGAGPVVFITAGLRERGDANAPAERDRTPEKLRLPFELIGREFAAGYVEPVQVFRDPQYPGLLHGVIRDRGAAAADFTRALSACVAGQLAFEPAVSEGRAVTGFADWKDGYLSSLLAWHMTETRLKATPAEAGETRSGGLSDETVKVLERCLSRGDLASFRQTVQAELGEAFRSSQIHFVKRIFHLGILLDKLHHSARPADGHQADGDGQLWLRPDLALKLNTVEKAVDFLVRLAERGAGTGAKEEQGDAELTALRAACRHIEENYMYDLNLTELAERFNYHPTYFSERFKAKIGKTFIQYLTDVRMAHAVRLLADTTLNLWDIAELTGFSNASYFSSKFKKVYGMTPSDYRHKASEKIDTQLPKK